MSDLDWPAGWDRTPPAEREHCHKFEATLGSTATDIKAEMGRMDVDDWRPSIGNQHTKSSGLPLHNANPDDPGFVLRWSADGEQFAVACDAYTELRDNCREVYLWINETRMRSQRAVATGQSEFAAAQLPSGEDGVVVADTGEQAHEVLGVGPDAPDREVEAAYRERVQEVHPDKPSGDEQKFKRAQEAKDALTQ